MTICSVRPRPLLAFDRRGTRTHHCHDVRDLASISDPNRLPTPFCILRHNSLFTHFCMGPSRVGDNVDCKCNGATAVQHLDTSLLTQALDAESCVTNPCGTARGCCLVQTLAFNQCGFCLSSSVSRSTLPANVPTAAPRQLTRSHSALGPDCVTWTFSEVLQPTSAEVGA
jgi:hypothetical protein